MSRSKRTDADYENQYLTRGLLVLEALEGVRWEPVPVKTIIERTGLNRDQVDRALKTLRLRGYAVQVDGKWTIGKRFMRLGRSVAIRVE